MGCWEWQFFILCTASVVFALNCPPHLPQHLLPTTARYLTSDCKDYSSGAACFARCPDGFHIVGNSRFDCSVDGEWLQQCAFQCAPHVFTQISIGRFVWDSAADSLAYSWQDASVNIYIYIYTCTHKPHKCRYVFFTTALNDSVFVVTETHTLCTPAGVLQQHECQLSHHAHHWCLSFNCGRSSVESLSVCIAMGGGIKVKNFVLSV